MNRCVMVCLGLPVMCEQRLLKDVGSGVAVGNGSELFTVVRRHFDVCMAPWPVKQVGTPRFGVLFCGDVSGRAVQGLEAPLELLKTFCDTLDAVLGDGAMWGRSVNDC